MFIFFNVSICFNQLLKKNSEHYKQNTIDTKSGTGFLRSDCNFSEKHLKKCHQYGFLSACFFPHVGSIWVGRILKVSGCCDVLAPRKRSSDPLKACLQALLVHKKKRKQHSKLGNVLYKCFWTSKSVTKS